MAVEQQAASNLALISVPGDYAVAEAIKALRLDMSVMLFSYNVSLAHERAIKTLAAEKDLLVMGNIRSARKGRSPSTSCLRSVWSGGSQ
jgi:FdrA protein